jgi:hypothetical protein
MGMAMGRIVDSETVVQYRRGEFLISTDPERLSLDVIHGFLTNCYWAKGISREIVARSIEHSLCFGIYGGTGAQLGFARVVSDFATVAYLGDVFVLESHRRIEQVADAMRHGASRASKSAALDSLDPRRARTLFPVWLYSGEGSRAIYGAT